VAAVALAPFVPVQPVNSVILAELGIEGVKLWNALTVVEPAGSEFPAWRGALLFEAPEETMGAFEAKIRAQVQ
jgi:hypothetical protein